MIIFEIFVLVILFVGLYHENKKLKKEKNELFQDFNNLKKKQIKEKEINNKCKQEVETYVKPFEKEITHNGKLLFFFEAQSFRVLQSAGADMVTINKETCICGCLNHNYYIVNVFGNSGLIFQLLAK